MSELGVRAIRVAFGRVVALDDVTLEVPTGRVTAVVGGDGAGKSTLLRVLAGRVAVHGGEVRTLRKSAIGYQPSTSGVWGGLTVDENVSFVAQAFRMPRARARDRAEALLERAGLTPARGRLGRDLSGGMRQKLGFVLAILHEPRLVLLDEPSTGVDPVSRVELWRLIAEAATGDTAVLMATTYLDEAARAASVTALDAGVVIGSGAPAEIIASMPGRIVEAFGPGPDTWRRGTARHAWIPPIASPAPARPAPRAAPGSLAPARSGVAISGLAAASGADRDPGTGREGGDGGGAGGQGEGQSSLAPDLEDSLIALTLARAVRRAPASSVPGAGICAPDLGASDGRAGPAAEARGITRRFGTHVAVDTVSVQVRPGEIVGLIGANGAGKTTLLRTLIGLDRPDEGQALLFGAPPSAASRARLGYVPQGLGLYRTISVEENAEFFARVYRMPRPELAGGLADAARKPVGEIGLGRQRRLAFALALAHRPELLVLDEPTSGVDPLSRARLWDVIHAQADAGVAVIVTTHYLQEAEQCTRLALLSQGHLVGAGSVDELTAGIPAVEVRADDWPRAFAALGDAGLPTMLSGRDIRVAGHDADEVRAALVGMPAEIRRVAPTLEEAMVLREA